MSKFEAKETICSGGSGAGTITSSSSKSCVSNSSSESEDIGDIFRARVAALFVDDPPVPVKRPPLGSPQTNKSGYLGGNNRLYSYKSRHHSTSFKTSKIRLTEVSEYRSSPRIRPASASTVIKEVWQENLYEEFVKIRKLIQQKYNHVGMDTEFPGVVILPEEDCRNSGEYQFEVIRTNVDALKLIQLGISFFDMNGNPPAGISTWQFNFKFNLETDLNAQDSIDLLKDSGVQFNRLHTEGIDPVDFCELFISSGLVLNPDVFWLTYHGGYDFGYLMRILLGKNLPEDGDEFLKIMNVFFPCCYDVKVMLADCGNVRGGLQDVSMQLGLKRIGIQHQAGSDALLTGMTFFRIKQRNFANFLNHRKYNGRIHGLSHPVDEG